MWLLDDTWTAIVHNAFTIYLITDIIEFLKTNEDLRSILEENDTFVLDRGFRDCQKELNDKYKFKVKMPAVLSKNQKQ